ncbi:MAG: aspartate 1-decarboxylase [Candidatus Tectimicrobiota bacterium]
MRLMLTSKLHRAVVTEADIDYEGSITIDADLMAEVDIVPYERVEVYNITNGDRFTTYAIEGEAGSGTVCINGAAAHRAQVGDRIIVCAYRPVRDEEARSHKPKILVLDEANRPQRTVEV